MSTEADTAEQYINRLPDNRKDIIRKLRKVISDNLPPGFAEEMQYGMIGYVVPKSVYPEGYHAKPELPLPFINIASQKNHIAIYHMGLYTDSNLMEWFRKEFSKYSFRKPDIGKSCIRFKNAEDVPIELIGQLAGKISVETWIKTYQENLRRQ